jgi:hypothetical protein
MEESRSRNVKIIPGQRRVITIEVSDRNPKPNRKKPEEKTEPAKPTVKKPEKNAKSAKPEGKKPKKKTAPLSKPVAAKPKKKVSSKPKPENESSKAPKEKKTRKPKSTEKKKRKKRGPFTLDSKKKRGPFTFEKKPKKKRKYAPEPQLKTPEKKKTRKSKKNEKKLDDTKPKPKTKSPTPKRKKSSEKRTETKNPNPKETVTAAEEKRSVQNDSNSTAFEDTSIKYPDENPPQVPPTAKNAQKNEYQPLTPWRYFWITLIIILVIIGAVIAALFIPRTSNNNNGNNGGGNGSSSTNSTRVLVLAGGGTLFGLGLLLYGSAVTKVFSTGRLSRFRHGLADLGAALILLGSFALTAAAPATESEPVANTVSLVFALVYIIFLGFFSFLNMLVVLIFVSFLVIGLGIFIFTAADSDASKAPLIIVMILSVLAVLITILRTFTSKNKIDKEASDELKKSSEKLTNGAADFFAHARNISREKFESIYRFNKFDRPDLDGDRDVRIDTY